MNKTVFEKGIEKGIEKGRQALLEVCVHLLEKQFGPVSAKLREHIEGLSLDALRQLTFGIGEAESLEAIGLGDFVE
jgi:hypothetical protein